MHQFVSDITMSKFVDFKNGYIQYSNALRIPGAIAQFSCDKNFALDKFTAVQVLSNGRFNDSIPLCKRNGLFS